MGKLVTTISIEQISDSLKSIFMSNYNSIDIH